MKFKIAYLLPGGLYNAGGMERVTVVKANYLAEKGYDVSIITTEQMGRPVFFPINEKVSLFHLDIGIHENFGKESYLEKCVSRYFKIRQYRKELNKLLNEISPDITVSTLGLDIEFLSGLNDGSIKLGELHFPKNFRQLMANKLSKNFLPNLVASFRTRTLQNKCRALSRLIVLTEEEKSSWKQDGNVLVIPNPLPFIPDEISQCNQKKAIAVGRLVYEKGFDLLIESWKAISGKYPDWTLDIFGDGNQRDILHQLVAENKLEDVIKIHQPVENIYIQYQEHSMLIFPSRYLDALPMVLIEAMSCGLPLISFNSPCGPKDVIQEGKNGFLVETGDTKTLTERISCLIESEDIRKQMGKEARKASLNYQVDQIMNRWLQLFDEVIGEHKNKQNSQLS